MSIFKFHTKLPPSAQSSPGPDRSRHRRTGPRYRRIASAPAPLSTSPPQQQTRKGPESRGSWPLFLLRFGRQEDCYVGFVDACLNNDFQVQMAADRRRAAQRKSDTPLVFSASLRRSKCVRPNHPHPLIQKSPSSADKRCKGVLRDPSRDFADQLVLSVSTFKRETSRIGLHAFRSC